MKFLRKVCGVTFSDKVCICEIRTANIEPLLRIEKSQLRLFGHVTGMTQERLGRHVLLATPTEKWPRGWPRTRWCDDISDFAWSRLSVDPAELKPVRCFQALDQGGEASLQILFFPWKNVLDVV